MKPSTMELLSRLVHAPADLRHLMPGSEEQLSALSYFFGTFTDLQALATWGNQTWAEAVPALPGPLYSGRSAGPTQSLQFGPDPVGVTWVVSTDGELMISASGAFVPRAAEITCRTRGAHWEARLAYGRPLRAEQVERIQTILGLLGTSLPGSALQTLRPEVPLRAEETLTF